jgi:hypothetical protein
MMGFIDVQRSQGHAVESVCRVLREQGCQIAARTYRSWKQAGRPIAARMVSDALVVDAVRQVAWVVDPDGVRKLTPEGLYGRRKMTAHLRRTCVPDASAGAVEGHDGAGPGRGAPGQGHPDHDPGQGRRAGR